MIAFVRLGEELLIPVDKIVGAQEDHYSTGSVTRIYVLGHKSPFQYAGPLSDLEDALRKVISAALPMYEGYPDEEASE